MTSISIHIRQTAFGYMKTDDLGSWLTSRQRDYLLERKFKAVIEREGLQAVVEKRERKHRDELKRLRMENRSLKQDNAILRVRLEGYEKRRA